MRPPRAGGAPAAPRTPFLIGILLVVVAAASFALGNTLAKASYGVGVTALTVLAGRSWLALIALVTIAIATRQRPRLPRAALRPFLFTITMNCFQNPVLLLSFQYVPVGLAILILYSFPVIVAITAAIVGHDRITPTIAIAAVAGFAGVALVLEVGMATLDWRGVLLAGAAAFFLAFNVLGAARMGRHMPALHVPTWIYAVSAPVFTVVLFLGGGPRWPTVGWGWWVYVAAISALPLAVTCFYTALPRAGPARASVAMNFEPLFTVALAALILGERLGPVQLAGAVLIVGAAFLAALRGRPRGADAPSGPA